MMDKFKTVLAYIIIVLTILFLVITIGHLLKFMFLGVILFLLGIALGYICMKASEYLMDNHKWPF